MDREIEYEYKYDPSDNFYCYRGIDVLRNKFHVKNREQLCTLERRATFVRQAELLNKPVAGRFGLTHLCNIHKYIFQDVYNWAGQIRNAEFLTKGGDIFCLGSQIYTYAKHIFDNLKSEKHLKNLPKQDFTARLAYYMGEVNALHPFREGNGRTQREFFRTLSLNAGYILNFANAPHGSWVQADISAFNKDYEPLVMLLQSAVT